jgi:two-component system, chemotaxis family, chemotaxis protein CheY
MKLIVADDSRMVRGIVAKVVESMGHEAVPAANGREALERLEADGQNIRLVLLDWNMPFVNGMEVIKKMRGDDRFKKIPVLMVSTESEDEKIQEAIQAGAQGYLTKPFTPGQLAAAVARVLENGGIAEK